MTEAGERLALDANVLVYAVDFRAGEKHERARVILRRLAGTNAVVPLQALAEFYATVSRKAMVAHAFAAQRIADWQELFSLAAADGPALSAAVEAVARHQMSFWDAMLWATVRDAGATVLLTEDMQDGASIGGVRFRNPFAGSSIPSEITAHFR